MRRFWIGLVLGVTVMWLVVRRRYELARLLGWETPERGMPARILLPEAAGQSPQDTSASTASPVHPTRAEPDLLTRVRALIEEEGTLQAYCPRCRTHRLVANPQPAVTRKGRPAVRGTCAVCGSKVFRFVRLPAAGDGG